MTRKPADRRLISAAAFSTSGITLSRLEASTWSVMASQR